MANRILILDSGGTAICALDGHHGAAHAARWAAGMVQRLAEQGIAAAALEIVPEQGGDEIRRGVFGALHRVRAEFHLRPDGQRELVGLVQHPESKPVHEPRAKGITPAAAPEGARPIRGGLRLLTAPDDVHGERYAIRIPRGRLNHAPDQPRGHSEARIARRLARAAKRKPA